MINLGVLGSTNGTDLQPILDAIGTGKLDAKVSVVISNREDAYILERAKKHNTPNVFINHKLHEVKNVKRLYKYNTSVSPMRLGFMDIS